MTDDPDDLPEPDDERSTEVSRREPTAPRAALAPNWRTVLAVDAGMGLVLLLAGIVLALVWSPVGGGFMGSLGLVYLVLVARRARTWSQLRRDAGL